MGLGTGSFATALNLPAGNQPSSVTYGDYNGDGTTDIACSNFADTSVSVFLGAGAGNFLAAASHKVLFRPSALISADINQDGLSDIAIVSSNSSNIVTLTASGAGNFNPPITHVLSNAASLLLAGDYNYDGHVDIVAAINGSEAILAGNGTGNFAAPVYYAVGGFVNQGLAQGDFDQDGRPDIAACVNNGGNPYNVSVLISCHDTLFCFGTPVVKAATAYGGRLIIADINNDGNSDALAADAPNGMVAVYTSNVTGNFTNSQNLPSASPTGCAAADLNNDGHTDLAFSDNSWNSASVRLNNGAGSFPSYTNFTTGNGPSSILAADLNKDGNQDLVTANRQAHNITVLLGNGTGNFTASNFVTDSFPQALACADLNGDGDLDIVTVNNGAQKDLSVLLGNGSGGFAAPISYLNGGNPVDIRAADLNGDAKPDIITVSANSYKVAVRLGTGSGTLGSAVYYTAGTIPLSLWTGDLNLDGNTDIAVLNQNNFNQSSTVSVFAGRGNGALAAPLTYTLPYAGMLGIAAGDFDHDTKMDLLAHEGYLLEMPGCWTQAACVASVKDSLYKDALPFTWDLVPHYSPQVNNAIWFWGDGTSSTGLYPSHTYTAAGRYSICVKVYTSCGDSASTCRTADSLYRMTSANAMVYVNIIPVSNAIATNVGGGWITIYPNPANDRFSVLNVARQKQNLQLYDLAGKCVLQMEVEPGQTVTTDALANGIYFVTVRWGSSTANKKLIIAH